MVKLDNKKMTVITLFISLVAGLFGGALMMLILMTYGSLNFTTETETKIDFAQADYVSAWEAASPAVISVVALKDLSSYYSQFSFNGQPVQPDTGGDGNLSEVSSGTAFIVTPDGLAITNKHVVSDGDAQYVALMPDGVEYDVTVLGTDPLNDIALIQLSSSDENDTKIGDLPYLEFADSDEISVGEPVLAIGNALGEYSNTTTAGIISATGRSIVAASGFGSTESLVGLIQTDAAINPGNSGGPLVDMTGHVIGMNTAVDTTAEGIGFALPANDIAMVLTSYQENGRIVRPFLGVRYVMVNDGIVNRLKLDTDHGALVTGDPQAGLPAIVPDSSAADAGLQEGDIILTFGGKELNEDYTLSNAVAGYLVGEDVVLEVWRDGKTIEINMTLEEKKSDS